MPNSNLDTSSLDVNIIKRDDTTKEQLHNIISLNIKNALLIVNYNFGDGWQIKLKLEKIYGEDNLKNNAIHCVFSGKGYEIVEDCGGTHSLMQIAETQDLKTVDLIHFDKHELNDLLLSNVSCFQTLYENKF